MNRILILEDETMIQMLVEDILLDMGVDVVGPASSLTEALALVEDCDAAILDVNLGANENSFPVAQRLTERGVPFVFLTGYYTERLDMFPDVPKLAKPIVMRELKETVTGYLLDR